MKTRKTILITGASRGIGKALAEAYAATDVHLVLNARQATALQNVAETCRQLGAQVTTHTADIRKPEWHQWLQDFACSHPIDLVIANAGMTCSRHDQASEDFEQLHNMLTTNIFGTVNTIEALIPTLRTRQHGHIALVSSWAGIIAFPQFPSYCLSKAGIVHYGKALRAWLKREGIDVSIICPGFVKSDMSDCLVGSKPGLCSTQIAAKRIQRGLAKRRRYIIFPRLLFALLRLATVLPLIRQWTVDRMRYDFRSPHDT